MKKIAILTFYYGINSIGALLQAYALNDYVNRSGHKCHTLQLKEDRSNTTKIINRILLFGPFAIKFIPVLC